MNVIVNLTSPRFHSRSTLPDALLDLHKGSRTKDSLLDLIDHRVIPVGPNNTIGFVVTGERLDVISWLDLVLEKYPSVKEEISAVKKRIRQHVIRGGGSSCVVSLNDISRQHPYNGELINKEWYWTDVPVFR